MLTAVTRVCDSTRLVFTNTPGASVSSGRFAVDVRRFPWIRPLAIDYAHNFAALAPFFSGNPADREAWADAIRRVQAQSRRGDIAAIVAAQQRRRGAPAAALDAAARLSSSKTVAVVTGQQAGLFGGPLFTLLKALTAIQLCDALSRDQGVAAVPIFWVEAEDHDWNEVRSCTVFGASLEPHDVGLPERRGDPIPVGHIVLDDSIGGVLGELGAALPQTEFTPDVLHDLGAGYAPGVGMSDAFARWIERVLGPRGLVVFDASDPAAKPLAAPVFARELSTPGRTSELAATTGASLASRGYHVQVQAQQETLSLFRLDGARRAIRHRNGTLLVGDEQLAPAALAREAGERPSGFSPGVLLRPIVQDTLFPTVCYVAGPNELAYLGQLRGVYEHFGVPMPLMYPRASATLVDSSAFRFLTKYGLALESLQPQDDSALNALLESQIPGGVDQAFRAAASGIDAAMGKVAEELLSVDPTLEGAARTTLGRMQHDLDTLHAKMIQAAKRRDETLRRQFAHARALAFPHGHPQERSIGFVSFLNQYGPALIDRLYEELPLDIGRHWVITI